MLTVAVLGPAGLRRDGTRLPVPAGKTTELLVRLALEAGVLVRVDRLIEDLWASQARGLARNTLQSKVSKLRRVLGDPALVTGGATGYTLDVDPSCVDAIEVLRLAATATTLREAGDAAAAVPVCANALSMFRGEILPSAGHGEWLVPYRARLEETRLRLTEDHLGARIDLGAAGELVGELETLTAAHPLRERLWELLITVLYRSGRQADALAAYRRVQQQLSGELGLDPGDRLRELEQQILRHDQKLAGPASGGRATLAGGLAEEAAREGRAAGRTETAPAEQAPGNLPGLSASLVGRAADLAGLSRLLDGQRLVTLTGPAGVGKTRLAIEVARGSQASGGAWLVRLESARSSEAVWHDLGDALNLGAATPAMVLERLREADLLLVFDNCEHLTAELPELIGTVLSTAPGVRVLATSQVPLAMDGEVVVPLEPLTLADSMLLFAERAQQQRRSFSVDAETGPVVESVCRSLDGLPLAIELAAARAKALSVQEISRRLDDRFGLLKDPGGRRPARQRTLSAAISWSYDLLFPDDQRGLWALSCFSGGAPLGAVEQVLAALDVPAATALDVVDRLIDRSLVSVDVGAGGGVRYRLLDSVAEFSRHRLDDAGLAEQARAAHAQWFADAGTAAAQGIRGRAQAEHLALARTERANIDAALAWTGRHDPLTGVEIANGFGWAWAVLGSGAEGADRIRAALAAAAPAGVPGQVRATGLLLAGWLEAAGGNLDLAEADLDEALQLSDDDLRSAGQVYLAFLRTQQGRPYDVLGVLAACRPELERFGRDWELGASWLLCAWAETALGRTDLARAACDQALRLLGALGDDWALIHAEALLGGLAQAEHRFTTATAHLQRAAEAAHRLGFDAAEALHLTNLGRAEQQSGNHRAAAITLERAIDAAVATGDLRMASMARVRLARVLRSLGETATARTAAQAAQQWYLSAGGGDGTALAAYALAVLDADDADPQAAGRLATLLEAARQTQDTEVELLALDALARLHAEQGDQQEAAEMLEAADQLHPAIRHLVTSDDRIDADRARPLLQP